MKPSQGKYPDDGWKWPYPEGPDRNKGSGDKYPSLPRPK